MLTVPELLAREAPVRYGEAGRVWLASIPERAERLSALWDVEVGTPFEPGGVGGIVLRTSRPDAVLKLGVVLPFANFGDEAAGLLAWDGRGAVRVLAHAPDDNATLLERCVPGTRLDLEPDQHVVDEIGMQIAMRLWAAEPAAGVESVAHGTSEQCERIGRLWTKLGEPFKRSLADDAIVTLEALRDSSPERAAALHGDFHADNILRAEREPWLAIDPLPRAGDPAHDVARWAIHRQKIDPMGSGALRKLIRTISRHAGVDAERVSGWAFGSLVCRTLESINAGDPGAARRLADARLFDSCR